MALIATPLAEPITTTTWQPINANSSTATHFIARTRSGNSFRLSGDSNGTTYFTVGANETLQGNIPSGDGVLFYAQAVSTDDTLEVLLS